MRKTFEQIQRQVDPDDALKRAKVISAILAALLIIIAVFIFLLAGRITTTTLIRFELAWIVFMYLSVPVLIYWAENVCVKGDELKRRKEAEKQEQESK